MRFLKTLAKGLLVVAVILLIGFIGLFLFSQPLSQYALRQSGFPDATIEQVRTGLSGTTLTNIRLNTPLYRLHIGQLDAYALPADLTSGQLGKAVLRDVTFEILPATAAETTPDSADENFTLPRPLNLRLREAEVINGVIIPPAGLGPLRLDATLLDRGPDYHLAGTVTAEGPLTLEARLSVTAHKTDGTARAQMDIDKGRFEAAHIDIKRLAGWATLELPEGAATPRLDAQLSAGSANIYGVPLQGLTLAATADSDKTTAVLTAQAMNNSGAVSADITLDHAATTDAAAVHSLRLALDAKLEKLENLGVTNMQGAGNMALDIHAQKPAATAWQDIAAWQSLTGQAVLSARGLSLPGLLEKAEAAGKLTLNLDPAATRLTAAQADGPLTFKGLILPIDAKSPVSLNIPYHSAEPAALIWDGKAQTISLRFKGLDANLPLLAVRQAAAAVTANLEKPALAGKISATEIALTQKPAYIVPLRMEATFAPDKETPGATALRGTLTEKNGLASINIRGAYDPAAQKGRLSLRMPPVTLIAGVHKITDIFPAANQYVTEASGTIGLGARLAWDAKATPPLSTRGRLLLREFNAGLDDIKAAGINTVLTFESLMPPVFKEQKMSVGAITAGLPLTEGIVAASLDAKQNITLHQAEWALAGGKVSSSSFTTNLKNPAADITLTATGLKLDELFRIAPLDGLMAEGTVRGVLPLEMRQGQIRLVDGILEAAEPGKITYNPKVLPAFLQDSSQKQLVDLRVALKAFAFEELKLTLNGTLGGEQKIGLQAKGKNPEFYEGYPVNINLNVEGPLENILRYNPAGSQIPDSIKKQLEDFEKEDEK